jgi:hypothetical protein
MTQPFPPQSPSGQQPPPGWAPPAAVPDPRQWQPVPPHAYPATPPRRKRPMQTRRTLPLVLVVVLVVVLGALIAPWVSEFARGMADAFSAGFNSTYR